MTTQTAPFGTGRTNPTDPRNPAYLETARRHLSEDIRIMQHAELALAVVRSELKTMAVQLDDRAAELRLDVTEETNGGGKPKYSNADARADAVRLRLRDDSWAQTLRNRIGVAEVKQAELQEQFDSARRSRQAELALLSFAGQWLGWITHYTTDAEEY